MFRNKGIAFKLVFFILLTCLIIFLLLFGYNYLFSKKIIVKKVEENAKGITFAAIYRIETILRSMEKVPENMTYFLENAPYNKESLLNIIRIIVEKNPGVYGSTVAFEPNAFQDGVLFFSPYFYKYGNEIRYEDLGKESYKYFQWDWYSIPKKLNRSVWSEPYYDEGGGNIIMSTYSVPFYNNAADERTLIGVITADISLNWLREIVSSIKIFKTGYGFLISKKGTIVTHPDNNLIMKQNIFSIAETIGNRDLEKIGKEMIQGKSGFVRIRDFHTDKDSWCFYGPLASTGWSLGIIFPNDELMEDINRLNRIVLMLALGGFICLAVIVLSIATSITQPLSRLARATELIGRGNLDVDIPPAKTGDEVGKLTNSFINMKRSLKNHIRELAETTAQKERIESELKIAGEIQMSFIPKEFPPFPERSEFDIFAAIKPAREVGGDFYDFFFIDRQHLFFVIGDVTGKGVPASLYMAVAMTLIRDNAGKGDTPGTILSKANKELSRNNDSAMFVTTFCGILNTETGEILYTNAGHNPPILIPKAGAAAFLATTGDIVLGVVEGVEYATKKQILSPGDSFFLYTDGVTEATNKRQELFSSDRLLRECALFRQEVHKTIITDVLRSVTAFAGVVPQSDDITMLVLHFRDADKSPPWPPETPAGRTVKGICQKIG